MPEYHYEKPFRPSLPMTRLRKKSCQHLADYRCCCHAHEGAAHEDSDQDRVDLVTELTMPLGYRLARAYSRELYGDDNLDA